MINFSDIISTTLVNVSVHVHKCACQIFICISQISTLLFIQCGKSTKNEKKNANMCNIFTKSCVRIPTSHVKTVSYFLQIAS